MGQGGPRLEADNLSPCDLSERETGRGVQHVAVPSGTSIGLTRVSERSDCLYGSGGSGRLACSPHAQIKELYKDSWETIPGNSDTILYLGGNEASTHKYISEALGKATIDTKTHGQTKGKSGSYSTNFQMSGSDVP